MSKLRNGAASFVVAALLAACATPPAPAPDPRIDLSLRTAVGDTWAISYEADLASSTLGAPQRRQVSEQLTVEVLAADRWRWTPTSGGDGALSGAVIECRVDAAGRCLEVSNWTALQTRLASAAAPVVETAAAAPSAALIGQVISRIDATQAAGLLLQNTAILGRIQGLRMEVGHSAPFDATTPNPLGGPPVPARGLVTLMSVDRAAGTALVRFRQELDAAQAGAVLRQSMAQVLADGASPHAETAGASVEESMQLIDVLLGEIHAEWMEDGEATIDLATGRAREAVSTVSGRVHTVGGVLPFNLTVSGTATIRQSAVGEGPAGPVTVESVQ